MVMCVKDIFLKKSIVENSNITSEGIMVYIGLVMMSENKIDRLYTSIAAIEFMFKMNFDEDRYFRDKIKKGLENLKTNNLINIFSKNDDLKPNDYIAIKLNNFTINTSKELFILLDVKEIINIVNYSEKRFDVDKLLRYFIMLVSTINNNSKIGFTTIESLSCMSYVSDNTISTRYNAILENLKIIYIYRHEKSVRLANGEIRKVNNSYGRFKDKEIIKKEAMEYCNELSINNISSDEARSIKQKYNNMIKKINNGYVPTEEEINQTNANVMRYNSKYKHYTEMKELKMISC